MFNSKSQNKFRFMVFKKNLRFYENNNENTKDKVWKLRFVVCFARRQNFFAGSIIISQ